MKLKKIEFTDKLFDNVGVEFKNEPSSELLKLLINIFIGVLVGCLFILISLLAPLLIIFTLYNDIISFVDWIRTYKAAKIRNNEIRDIMYNYGQDLIKNNSGLLNLMYIDKYQGGYNQPYQNYGDIPRDIFIKDFILNINKQYHTLNSDNTIQCNPGKRRSLGDIYLICKYYYPSCTIEQVIKQLILLLNKKIIYASYCSTIHKYVFHVDSDAYIKESKTEYPNNIRWEEIVKVYG